VKKRKEWFSSNDEQTPPLYNYWNVNQITEEINAPSNYFGVSPEIKS
jgi:hypothetical protein